MSLQDPDNSLGSVQNGLSGVRERLPGCEPGSPQTLLQRSWILIALSVGMVPIVLFGNEVLIFFGTFGIWLLPLIAFVLAWVASIRNRAPSAVAVSPVPRRRLRVAILLSAVLAMGHLGACWAVHERYRVVDATIATSASLNGIGQALARYSVDHGVPAPSLSALVAEGTCPPKQLGAPLDPEFRAGSRSGSYSSYVYEPAPDVRVRDGGLVVAFDREPWSRMSISLFGRRGRLVLFGDGHVRFMDNAAFAEARREDARRRAELAWPTTQVHREPGPASEPAESRR